VVSAPPGVAIDDRHRLPGRGAWVHPSRTCIETATRRKAWARALRVSGIVVDAEALLSGVRPPAAQQGTAT